MQRKRERRAGCMETSQNFPVSEGAYGEAGTGLFIRVTGQGK